MADIERLTVNVERAARLLNLSDEATYRLITGRHLASITFPGTRERLVPMSILRKFMLAAVHRRVGELLGEDVSPKPPARPAVVTVMCSDGAIIETASPQAACADRGGVFDIEP